VTDEQALDFEKPDASHFAFRVVASQGGEEISYALVRVNITDANDNAPKFSFPSYRFSVNEDAPPHTSISVLQANDSDSGVFGNMSYSVKGFGSEKFLVNSSTGEISVAPCGAQSACLDFEHQNLYSLTFSSTDGGGRITSVNVFIDVIDVNDNPPSFDKVEYRRTVDEGVSYFDPPLFVKASDVDGKDQGGGVVTFAIRDGNTADGAFRIDPSSGEIFIARPLTHLDTPSSIYALTIRATDAGTPPRHSDVRVLVTVGRDKNRPPRFSKQVYYAKVRENADPGKTI
ncbi:UNVERIFIED_CONTAM: hypothetical protein GTU68_057246, partial [Idotea baltica]|nr:hypothetical protein [Idotea baltica]